jgi:hypothetical protein
MIVEASLSALGLLEDDAEVGEETDTERLALVFVAPVSSTAARDGVASDDGKGWSGSGSSPKWRMRARR